MKPLFSIITPTLQRPSLLRCCESVDRQTFQSWEHLIFVDAEILNGELAAKVSHEQRAFLVPGVRYNDYGNTPRHLAWGHATAEWIIYCDDDNYIASPDTLLYLSLALEKLPQNTKFAIFPILRHSQRFFNDPPGLCMSDTANVVVRREVGRWPAIQDYTADGIWIEALKAKYKYAAFPDFDPIVVMEKSNLGL